MELSSANAAQQRADVADTIVRTVEKNLRQRKS